MVAFSKTHMSVTNLLFTSSVQGWVRWDGCRVVMGMGCLGVKVGLGGGCV